MTYQAQLDLFSLGTIEIDVMTLSLPNICQWMGGRVSMQCKKYLDLAMSPKAQRKPVRFASYAVCTC